MDIRNDVSEIRSNRVPNSPKIKKQRSLSQSGFCDLCCEKSLIFSIGCCDHPICYKCSARMRVLSSQMYCSSCRSDMDQVVFTRKLQKYSAFKLQKLPGSRRYGIRFEDKSTQNEFHALLENVCNLCSDKNSFTSLKDLKSHLRKVHEKSFCDICIENLTVFPFELKPYSKTDLVKHRKNGDLDDKSHRGHPDCRFCDERYFDNDHLLTHLRKTHFWCHICEKDGNQDYYDVYNDLRQHFGEHHFLCDEGSCKHEKFTSVFREKMDFQAHKLAYHGKNLSKIQAKEARKIEIDIRYDRRSHGGHVTGLDYEDCREEFRHQKNNQRGDNNKQRHEKDNQRRENSRNGEFEDFDERRKIQHDKQEKLDKKPNMPKQEAIAKKNGKTDKNDDLNDSNRSDSPPQPDVRRRRQISDNDVIGMTEHINKSKDSDEDITPIECDESPPLLSSEPANELQIDTKLRVEDDFPTLPGAVNVPFQTFKKLTHEEAFPALGKAGKPTQLNLPNFDKVKKDPQPVVVNSVTKFKNKKKGKGKSSVQQRENDLQGKIDEDFPTLGKSGRIQTNNFETIKIIPAKDLLVGKATPQTKKAAAVPPGFDSNPFPNLMNSAVTSKHMKNKAPPPGIKSPFQQPMVDEKTRLMERNLDLLSKLKFCLDQPNLDSFKKLSGDFRKGVTDAKSYYVEISNLLGDNLKYIFSELVALLPDEKKRQELHVAHNNAKVIRKQSPTVVQADYSRKSTWKAGSPVIYRESKVVESVCPKCGAVFPQDQAMVHMESHIESFPSLPTAIMGKKDYSFMPSKRQYTPLKSAWGK